MMKIVPTIAEEAMFSALDQVALQHKVELRVTGGWVRDNLLGKTSQDYDIMVDKMSGEDFAKHFAKTFRCTEPAVIRANPEKSKHVETAMLKFVLAGQVFEVDFTMARTESYRRDSRIPDKVTMATPQEDAFRRDFTVNALFYNLRTRLVEDFTGLGILDLQDKIIRAPGDPFVRFMEDPLRIFRAVRFACRFGFWVEKSTESAMYNAEVFDTLFSKVAVERMGEELWKSLEHDPVRVFDMHKKLGTLDRLLEDALRGTEYVGKLEPWTMAQNNLHHQLNLWDHTLGVVSGVADDRYLCLAALLHDVGKRYRPIHQPNASGTGYATHEIHSAQIAEAFLRHLKLDAAVSTVRPIIVHHMRPLGLMDASDKALRRLLRDLDADRVVLQHFMRHIHADVCAKSNSPADSKEDIAQILQFSERLEKLSREPVVVPRNTCILNGNEIMEFFGRTDAGAWIKEIKEWLLDLQDENPGLTKEAAWSLLETRHGDHFVHEDDV